jgi:hypothetical protein
LAVVGEKKVCVACEAIVLSECVSAYAWMISSAIEMAPPVKLSDIKVIYGDGIFGGEELLGIKESCRIILDHQHLLSQDIGAWPQKFGGVMWAQLKADCTDLVKTYNNQHYNICLDRIRLEVRYSPSFSEYVEKNIHQKRHLFANHLLQHYRDILDATDELAKSVSNVSNLSVKRQYSGEIIRLTEIVKGNLKTLEGMPVQYLLDGQFSVYNQSSAGQQISAQDASLTDKCTMTDDQGKDVDVAIGPLTMNRAAPQPTHNHSKKRKKSKEVLEEKNSNAEAQLTKSRQKSSHTDDNNDDDETTSSVFLVN